MPLIKTGGGFSGGGGLCWTGGTAIVWEGKSTYADFGSLKRALEVLLAEKPHLMEEN